MLYARCATVDSDKYYPVLSASGTEKMYLLHAVRQATVGRSVESVLFLAWCALEFDVFVIAYALVWQNGCAVMNVREGYIILVTFYAGTSENVNRMFRHLAEKTAISAEKYRTIHRTRFIGMQRHASCTLPILVNIFGSVHLKRAESHVVPWFDADLLPFRVRFLFSLNRGVHSSLVNSASICQTFCADCRERNTPNNTL